MFCAGNFFARTDGPSGCRPPIETSLQHHDFGQFSRWVGTPFLLQPICKKSCTSRASDLAFGAVKHDRVMALQVLHQIRDVLHERVAGIVQRSCNVPVVFPFLISDIDDRHCRRALARKIRRGDQCDIQGLHPCHLTPLLFSSLLLLIFSSLLSNPISQSTDHPSLNRGVSF